MRGGRCSGKGGCVHGACCLACFCRDAHRHAGAGGDVPSADTAFDAGVQVVLARRTADIKCPAEYSVERPIGKPERKIRHLSLSLCGALCLFTQEEGYFAGLNTETFSPAFKFKVDIKVWGAPAISRCKTRCYMADGNCLAEVALPGGEVLRKVEVALIAVFACGGVVVSQGTDGVSVYDEDLTLLRSLSHARCANLAVSDCGGWVITSSHSENNVRLWDVSTGEAVACVPGNAKGFKVSLSRSASVFAMGYHGVQLYDWSGAALGCIEKAGSSVISSMQFTLCGKYLVVHFMKGDYDGYALHQYDVATMSCVRVFSKPDFSPASFAISPCSRVVLLTNAGRDTIETRHPYPY